MPFTVALISTGGTIEKTYDELHGVLQNSLSVLDAILASLTLEGVQITRVPLMNKDSLEMTEADHDLIAQTADIMAQGHDGVVICHGTDRLAVTGHRILVTEALCAVQVVAPGVYVAMHNRVLAFPGVRKDYERMTFVRA
jgi:L-asparaginase